MKKIALILAVISGLVIGMQQAFAASAGGWQPSGMILINNTAPVTDSIR